MKLTINNELKNGIETATKEFDQAPALAQRLVAWLNDMSQRDLTKQEHSRHLENVRKAVDLSGGEAKHED
jgi:hypothetical protein